MHEIVHRSIQSMHAVRDDNILTSDTVNVNIFTMATVIVTKVTDGAISQNRVISRTVDVINPNWS